ncbi:IS66 family transposase [Candidatus Pacearchaeota archaeon]|nr:IS66 family transposase [Candidatus Pacearchaeota archaeon]
MKHIRTNVFEENKRLREQLDYKEKQASEWQNKYYELLNELKKTQALLRQFLNENTPSSKLPFKNNINNTEKEPKPRGKPIGSNGGNKEAPENVDRKIKAKLERRCPRCGKIISIRDIDTRLRYVYDAIIKAIVIEVEEEIYPCDCGEFCIGTHPDIPKRGMIGYNLQTLFTELKFNFSGSYANISKFFDNVTNGKINFTPKAINDSVGRVANKLEPSYNKIEEELKNQDFANCDETSWPVNGVQWYLWMIVTSNFVFITIQNSRARRVLINIFGEDYHGGIISDCFKAYDNFAKWYQKCWAHLLRKAKFEAEKYPRKNIVKFYEQLKHLHKEMSDFLRENPSKELRIEKKKEFEKKLNQIINYKHWCKEAQSIIDNRLKAYRNHWLSAIEIEGISLDNNLCERKIRNSIGWRKMLGGHRTGEGAKQYAIIETIRQTWKHQGKYPYNELLNVIRN